MGWLLENLERLVGESWLVVVAMAPYLLLGFLLAGILSVVFTPALVERHLGRPGLGSILKAALLGIPLPICSCGVLPLAVSLRRHGGSRGATTSFLISTPQTGVDSILVTYSLLGPVFTLFRPLAALVSGVVGGLVVEGTDRPERTEATPPACTSSCCGGGERRPWWTRALRYGFLDLPADIGGHLLLGLVAAGVIALVVPEDFFAGALGGGLLGMVAMIVLGLPVYVCATASVPVAVALMAKGISPGAALVFLMVGPATNAAAVVALLRVLGRRATLLYLGAVALTALGSGTVLDLLFQAHNLVPRTGAGDHHLHGPLGGILAVLLLLLLLVPLVRKWVRRHRPSTGGGAPSAPP